MYQVKEGDQVIERFAVNLFDRPRAMCGWCRAKKTTTTRCERPTSRLGTWTWRLRPSERPSRHEIWKTLLLAALFVLMLEWYIYNRRVYL